VTPYCSETRIICCFWLHSTSPESTVRAYDQLSIAARSEGLGGSLFPVCGPSSLLPSFTFSALRPRSVYLEYHSFRVLLKAEKPVIQPRVYTLAEWSETPKGEGFSLYRVTGCPVLIGDPYGVNLSWREREMADKSFQMRTNARFETRVFLTLPFLMRGGLDSSLMDLALTENVSLRGARLISKVSRKPGELCELASLSGDFCVVAHVVYCERLATRSYRIGLELQDSRRNWWQRSRAVPPAPVNRSGRADLNIAV
jgi:hypothetical protein